VTLKKNVQGAQAIIVNAYAVHGEYKLYSWWQRSSINANANEDWISFTDRNNS